MGLQSPLWLLGLLAAGLPLYVHLLKKHKTEPVPFSSLMFFESRTQSSVKHRRLLHLLLLALRLAVVILLVLAFAGPYRKRPLTAASGERTLVVVIDESFSMRAADAGAVAGQAARLDEAKSVGASLLARRGGAKAQVIAIGSSVRVLTEPVAGDGVLRAALESVRPAGGRAALAEFTRALRSLAASTSGMLDVHLVSDLQKSSLPEGFGDLQLPGSVKLTLHPVGRAASPNWAVENVTAPPFLQDPKNARVLVTVAGYGTPAAARTVSIVAGGRTLASREAKIPASGRATVEFVALDISYGFARCQATIDGRDALAADDQMLFPMERADPRRVLLVHEARDRRSPLFFRNALASGGGGAFALDAVSAEQSGSLALSRYSFVVLADVGSLPASLEAEIRRFVSGGGAALVAAGPSSAKRARVPVSGDDIQEGRYFSRSGARFEAAGAVDTSHPSFRRGGRWEGVKFYYAVRADAGGARVIARLADQTPLLYERALGEGRLLVFTSGLDNVSNDLPVVPAFVPFVEQTARYLAGFEERRQMAAVGSSVELRSAREQSVAVDLIDPDGKRPLSLAEAARTTAFTVDREGFYELRRANGRHELIAVNADRRESDLGRMSPETISLWTGPADAQNASAPAPIRDESAEETVHYWWYVIMGMLVAALAETLVASRYLGAREEAA